MKFSKPTGIRIPKIDVNAPVTEVGLDTAGNLKAPPADDPNLAGWYPQSTAPGSAGNAIIDGHVDTPTGRAVFYLLGALDKGDTVDVTRADGSIARFAVDAIEVYQKNALPNDRVFGDTERPQLRLITCGGTYTKATGYQGNVVVYGHLSKAIPAAM